MVVPPKHPKMIIFSRKTPWLLGTTILGNPNIDTTCPFLLVIYVTRTTPSSNLPRWLLRVGIGFQDDAHSIATNHHRGEEMKPPGFHEVEHGPQKFD